MPPRLHFCSFVCTCGSHVFATAIGTDPLRLVADNTQRGGFGPLSLSGTCLAHFWPGQQGEHMPQFPVPGAFVDVVLSSFLFHLCKPRLSLTRVGHQGCKGEGDPQGHPTCGKADAGRAAVESAHRWDSRAQRAAVHPQRAPWKRPAKPASIRSGLHKGEGKWFHQLKNL